MKRVLADDIPIILPDAKNQKFRVPGISRDEFRMTFHPTWEKIIQDRLRQIAEIQAKRMRSAADSVAAMGMDALELCARDDAEAGRALKHARAYWDHSIFQERLREQSSAAAPSVPSEKSGRGNPLGNLFRRLTQSLDGLFATEEAFAPDVPDPVPVSLPAAASIRPVAPEEPVEIADSRQATINDLAEAVISDHRFRVAMIDGKLTISPAVDGWGIAIDVFSDEPAVQEAMRQRYSSPWLDVPSSERAATIQSIRDALRSPERRPIDRAATGWGLPGLPEAMVQQIRQWDGYDELQRVLRDADNYWTYRENTRDNHPTALPNRPAPEVPEKRPQGASALPNRSTGLDDDLSLRDQIWIERQRGLSR